METVLTLVVGFVLTGVIGNKILQKWQERSWFVQQRFKGQEKEFLALQRLAEEIATLLSARIFYTQRLAFNLVRPQNTKLNEATKDYDLAVKRWNEKLTSFYVRLPLLSQPSLAIRLEESIQNELVILNKKINGQLQNWEESQSVCKETIGKINAKLVALQARAINFNKEMLRITEVQRKELYYGKEVQFTSENLSHFSTWQLVKALFVRDINSFSVTRSPIDS